MPETGRSIGTPASIIDRQPPQTVAIELEPFELGNVRQDADRIGKVFLARQHRVQRAPGELAVADFAAARGAKAAHFADRIGREVIVQHEVRVGETLQPVDHLLAVLGAQRGGADRLRFAAGEQRRPVGAGQESDHRLDRADLVELAAVDAAAVLENRAANDVRFDLLDELVGGHAGLAVGIGVVRLHLGPGVVEGFRAGRLVGQLVSLGNVVADEFLDFGLHFRMVGRGQCPRILRGLFGQVDDGADNLLALVMRKHDRTEHLVLGQFLGLGLDHHHGVVRRSNDEVETAVFQGSGLLRVENILTVDVADAATADRAHEGHAGNGQRGRRGNHRHHVRLGLTVVRQDLADHVDLVVEPLREQRADRAVDQAAGERFLLGCAAFALEKAARDAPGGGELFLIVDGEREEVLPFLHRLGGRDGA